MRIKLILKLQRRRTVQVATSFAPGTHCRSVLELGSSRTLKRDGTLRGLPYFLRDPLFLCLSAIVVSFQDFRSLLDGQRDKGRFGVLFADLAVGRISGVIVVQFYSSARFRRYVAPLLSLYGAVLSTVRHFLPAWPTRDFYIRQRGP